MYYNYTKILFFGNVTNIKFHGQISELLNIFLYMKCRYYILFHRFYI